MIDSDILVEDGFANGILPDLDMTKTFGRHVGGPGNACLVVVVDGCGGGAKDGVKVEIFEDVADVKDVFRAFIGGVYFRFCCAARCDGLSF